MRLRPDFQDNIYVDLPVWSAGAFAYYVTYSPLPDSFFHGPKSSESIRTSLYYVDVAPNLQLARESFPLNALSIFSVLSKFMGKYPEEWEPHLKGINARGYNMVHFTPLMERGASNSSYSLADQLKFDHVCFPRGERDVVALVQRMETEHSLLSLIDVVWNHTAHTSSWLLEHPEAGYNVENAPWLEPALELDSALMRLSGNLHSLGLPTDLKSTNDLLKVMDGVKTHCIGAIRLWEFYVVDVNQNASSIVRTWEQRNASTVRQDLEGSSFAHLQESSIEQQAEFLRQNGLKGASKMGGRFARHIDHAVGAAVLASIFGKFDSQGHGATAREAQNTMVKILDILNVDLYREYNNDVSEIQEQIFNRAKYMRLDEHGPGFGPITCDAPLVEPYFTRLPLDRVPGRYSSKRHSLINNGWIWGADAMQDSAGPDSRAYLLRQVIVWGDCVKLRYGTSPEDNPFLWEHMGQYTRLMAKLFTAFRIDNCHSTPLAVAEYLLDQARQVRPNLAVFAELFTGSEETDYAFVKRLGLSALIREAMQAWSTAELSRLVHRHGGRPIGSFEDREVRSGNLRKHQESPEIVHKIKESPLHALFMDCTHDNETPTQKRDARDTLPNAALVNMCACATGSVMGYDEVYPKLVDLVNDTRLYTSFFSKSEVVTGPGPGGIGGIKKLLNEIHVKMGREGFEEMHVHHEREFVTVHRVHPTSRKGYFVIARTAFPGSFSANARLSATHLSGTKAKLLGCWYLQVDTSSETQKDVICDPKYLRGLPSEVVCLENPEVNDSPTETAISLPGTFPPGSIAMFETWIPAAEHSESIDKTVTSDAIEAFGSLSLVDLNFVLYRCGAEERDSSGGSEGIYDIPGHGPIVYAGLQGWWSVLSPVIRANDLGHPICNHLRNGQWPLDYILNRLDRTMRRAQFLGLEKPRKWFFDKFNIIRKLPSFLLPRYFALTIRTAYEAAWNRAIALLNGNIQEGQLFLQQLAMTSIQMTGLTNSASLWPVKRVPCMAAGLPHFATDWSRCWGRDVFIALPGLYLGTGRFQDAKEHIVAFASVLKHGMIPNLLSSGDAPRYNSRDSIWFLLQTIQDYAKLAPNGLQILAEKVQRRFLPYDDTYFASDDPRAYSKTSTVAELVQEAMQRHASGLSFREANAGHQLDMQMKSGGFDQSIKVDWETGFIFGGGQSNCGTWMDKMGESERAGSKGVPGTPRDGAAVEIIGMLYSTLVWLSQLHGQGDYQNQGVTTDEGTDISFADWATKIKSNFERCFYIPGTCSEDVSFDVDPSIINRRGIYKDLYRSGKPYEDYQLRCNFPIAMACAPDLFTPERALTSLGIADEVICGPLGMATLDPSDKNYRPYYNNSEDSEDFTTSKGRNYHQGPEWVWPRGYFLRAMLRFGLIQCKTKEERTHVLQQVARRLRHCKRHIIESPWAGLPELTNKNGEHCPDSVRSSTHMHLQSR